MLEIAREVEAVKGERLDWDRGALGITDGAWDKVIHHGIKPVIVFAHPEVLTNLSRSTGYYRTLAMFSRSR